MLKLGFFVSFYIFKREFWRAMGVTNVNTANKAQIVKLALNNKNKQVQNNAPEYMKMTGSIFNAPELKTNDKRSEIADLNTKQSIKTLIPTNNKKNKVDGDSFQDVDDASSGRAAIATGNKVVKSTEDYKKQTENDEKLVNQYSKDATKLSKDIANNDKKFAKTLQTQQKEFDRDNQKIQKAVKESEEAQKEIDDAKHELDGLLAANSFSVGGNQSSSGNSARINELQTFIGSKIGMMQKNGKTIYSLQRSQTRTLTRMKRTNKVYINTQKTNQKNIKSQENSTNSVIDTAQKIEQFSALTQAGGQALGLAGDGLIALGEGLASTLFGSSVGAVLITIGTGMKKVGAVMELVGQYGQAAANITKTAAYAAEGNLMGAMQSAMMAAQTGAAAVKSTTQIGKTWSSINEQARAAKQNIEAKAVAKETVNKAVEDKALTNAGMDISNMTKEQRQEALKGISKDKMKEAQNEALGGMTKKQAKKLVAADIRNGMATNEALSMDQLKALAEANSKGSLDRAVNSFNEQETAALKEKGWTKVADGVYQTKSGKIITSGKGLKSKQFKLALGNSNKALDKTLNKTFENMAKYGDNGNWGKKLQAFGSSFTSIGTIFMQNQAMNEMSMARKKPLPQYQMDARTRRIMQRNQMYANRFSYV
jgi:hypothetical protein